MPRCPSDLRLEWYLSGLPGTTLARHVYLCGGCRWRLARMHNDGVRFLRDVYPATRARVVARAMRWYRLHGPR